jgi:NADPH:quinone reductase-like Zn-dependent oxidoreductase
VVSATITNNAENQKMRKIVVNRPGGYQQLEIKEEPDPIPGPGEIIVAPQAIGINYADCIVRMGLYAAARQLGYPIVPGFEFAGRVVAVGQDVSASMLGRAVLGVTLFGGYSSRVRVPVEQVFIIPDGLGVLQAATLPTAFLTAWYAIERLAAVSSGASILVHSAAGGVGSAIVQMCRLKGCRVVGVVGQPAKVEIAKRMGCDEVIDKSGGEPWQKISQMAPAGFHAVFDATGVETLAGSYRCLRPTGRLITYGFHSMLPRRGGRPHWLALAWDYLRTPRFNPVRMAEANKSVMAFNLSFLFSERDLLEQGMGNILRLLEAGRVKPLDVTAYPFENVSQAHRDIESGQTTGKLALLIP